MANIHQKTLEVPGLSTPRFLIWAKGWIHGKLLHTAELDPETGILTSGYITGQTMRYYSACSERCEQAEERLKESWAEADRLLNRLTTLRADLENLPKPLPDRPGESGSQARERARLAGKRAAMENERKAILERLAVIRSAVRTEGESAEKQAEATAEALLSSFSAYGHGVTLRPVHERHLPPINSGSLAARIIRGGHFETWAELCASREDL